VYVEAARDHCGDERPEAHAASLRIALFKLRLRNGAYRALTRQRAILVKSSVNI